jgi:hypothetical protein
VGIFIVSPLLPSSSQSGRVLVILPFGVVGHLFLEGSLKVVAEATTVIEDADECVREFNLGHLPVGEFVIHEVFALTFEGFRNLAVDEREEFALVALDGEAGLRVAPPVDVGGVDAGG